MTHGRPATRGRPATHGWSSTHFPRLAAAMSLALLPLGTGLAGLHRTSQAAGATLTADPVGDVSPTTVTGPGCGTTTGTSHASTSSLVLAGQTSWVSPGGRFVLDLARNGPSSTAAASGLSVYVEVFDQLNNRSDFDETLCNQIPTALVKTFGPVPLSSLAPDPNQAGAVQMPITVTVPGVPAAAGTSSKPTSGSAGTNVLALSGCSSDCAGVYPVQVLLEPEGGTHVLSEFTTQLVLTQPATGSKPLALAWELPVTAAPEMTAKGVPALPAGSSASLGTLASSLANYPQVPLTLAPSPLTLAALSASTDKANHRTLTDLANWASESSHQVLAGPYGQVSPSSLAASGLSSSLSSQLQTGAAVLSSTLHVKPRTETWLSQGPLSEAGLTTLTHLSGQPVSRIVLSDSDLAPLPEQATITPIQPFSLASTSARSSGSQQSASGTHLEAVTADPGLASHLVDGPGAILAAHQLLADLAMIYFDAPNATYGRGVVLETPSSWKPDSSFLSVALAGLADSPIVQPVTLNQLFDQTPESTIEPYGGVLVRQLATASPKIPRVPTATLTVQRTKLDAFVSTLGSDRPGILTNMEDLLLAAESTDLSRARRSTYLDDLSKLIQDQFGTIKLQTDTVTLAARTAQLPVTITSDLDYPVSAVLKLTSDKLGFVDSRSTRHVTLSQVSKTVEYDVHVRATGRFPVDVSLVSPHDGLVLAAGQFAVRSSAFSPVAIGLTVGAGLVLAGWWGRTLLRGRRNRNRHLVPAELQSH